MMPALLEPAYRRFFERPIAYARFYGRYGRFDEALAAVPGRMPRDFDTAESAGMYRERLDRVHSEDYPVLFWLSRRLRPGLTVFDLGGHVGIVRHAFGRLVPLDETRWLCQDLPAVVKRGAEIVAARPAPGLTFTSEPKDGDGHDVWLTLGSLQYLSWDLADVLAGLARPPSTVIVNKLPVHPTFEAYTLQNTGTAICPYRIFAEQPFVASMRSAGYRLVESWKNPSQSCTVPFHSELDLPHYSGFLFERDAAAAPR